MSTFLCLCLYFNLTYFQLNNKILEILDLKKTNFSFVFYFKKFILYLYCKSIVSRFF